MTRREKTKTLDLAETLLRKARILRIESFDDGKIEAIRKLHEAIACDRAASRLCDLVKYADKV